MNFLLVMIGGAVGSAGRYAVGKADARYARPHYPGTLAVNLIGGPDALGCRHARRRRRGSEQVFSV